MTRGISEATDANGVTHHVRGLVRFVRLPKGRRRKNPAKQGYYVTQNDCSWWCTDEPIPANFPVSPGKAVDCMSCLVRSLEDLRPRPFNKTVTSRIVWRTDRTIMVSTPSGHKTRIFDVNTRSTQVVRTRHQTGRRR